MIRELMDHAVEIGTDALYQSEEACKDADLIIHTFMHAIGAHTRHGKNIPDIHVQLFPMFTPTGDYPNVTMPDLKWRPINRWTHEITRAIYVSAPKLGYEQVRRRDGLSKRKLYSLFNSYSHRSPTPILCA